MRYYCCEEKTIQSIVPFSVLLLSHIFDPEFEAFIAHCFKYYVESGCIEKMEFVAQRGIFANKYAALFLPLLTREG
jgi:hypothetical protein